MFFLLFWERKRYVEITASCNLSFFLCSVASVQPVLSKVMLQEDFAAALTFRFVFS